MQMDNPFPVGQSIVGIAVQCDSIATSTVKRKKREPKKALFMFDIELLHFALQKKSLQDWNIGSASLHCWGAFQGLCKI